MSGIFLPSNHQQNQGQQKMFKLIIPYPMAMVHSWELFPNLHLKITPENVGNIYGVCELSKK